MRLSMCAAIVASTALVAIGEQGVLATSSSETATRTPSSDTTSWSGRTIPVTLLGCMTKGPDGGVMMRMATVDPADRQDGKSGVGRDYWDGMKTSTTVWALEGPDLAQHLGQTVEVTGAGHLVQGARSGHLVVPDGREGSAIGLPSAVGSASRMITAKTEADPSSLNHVMVNVRTVDEVAPSCS